MYATQYGIAVSESFDHSIDVLDAIMRRAALRMPGESIEVQEVGLHNLFFVICGELLVRRCFF